jgi:hypothetical protein
MPMKKILFAATFALLFLGQYSSAQTTGQVVGYEPGMPNATAYFKNPVCWDVMDFGATTSSDLGSLISSLYTSVGSPNSICITLATLTATGPATYYTTSNPFSTMDPGNTQVTLIGGCGLQIITSVTWQTPAVAPDFESPNCPSGAGAASQAGTTLEPCATNFQQSNPGCGASQWVPLFNNNQSSPACAGTSAGGCAVPVGGPWSPNILTQGTTPGCSGCTVTLTAGSGSVSATAAIFTTAMIDAWIFYSSATKPCVGQISSVGSSPSSTATLHGILPSSGCGVGNGANFEIVEANEFPLLWIGGLSTTTSAAINSISFSAKINGWKLDCEGMANCIGFYTNNAEERGTFYNAIAVNNAKYQTCNFAAPGSGTCIGSGPAETADGGWVFDNSWISG